LRDERQRFVPVCAFSSLIRKNSKTFFVILAFEPTTADLSAAKVVSHEENCLGAGGTLRHTIL